MFSIEVGGSGLRSDAMLRFAGRALQTTGCSSLEAGQTVMGRVVKVR